MSFEGVNISGMPLTQCPDIQLQLKLKKAGPNT